MEVDQINEEVQKELAEIKQMNVKEEDGKEDTDILYADFQEEEMDEIQNQHINCQMHQRSLNMK